MLEEKGVCAASVWAVAGICTEEIETDGWKDSAT